MLQRVVRQLSESGLNAEITVATSASQRDAIVAQLGGKIRVVTEPERRDTFPAIALSSSWLFYERGCGADETVVVMPCDPFTEAGYFETIGRMAEAVRERAADLVLMGIRPTCPSEKFGYVVPEHDRGAECGAAGGDDRGADRVLRVSRFTEKPTAERAAELISEGAFWNGGVFAFTLGYIMGIVRSHVREESFEGIRSRYSEFPKISFDYEVAEKAESVAVVPFGGQWKDLGTWNALAEELGSATVGNVLMDETAEGTCAVNALDIPLLCVGTRNLVVAASYDGILVSDRERSESIRSHADRIHLRPMYEELSWGEYRVVDLQDFPDGVRNVTRRVVLRAGHEIGRRIHRHRDEVWSFVDGEGLAETEGRIVSVGRGSTVCIPAGTIHSLKAVKDLCFIELQTGSEVSDSDAENYPSVFQ